VRFLIKFRDTGTRNEEEACNGTRDDDACNGTSDEEETCNPLPSYCRTYNPVTHRTPPLPLLSAQLTTAPAAIFDSHAYCLQNCG